eukprot:4732347-Lingulodinium_polyedra.AAC.1
MVPCSQGCERPDAVGAVLHCEGKPVRDCSRNCGGAAGGNPQQQGFLVNSCVLVVRHNSVDSDHNAKSLAQTFLNHFCADLSFGPHYPVP